MQQGKNKVGMNVNDSSKAQEAESSLKTECILAFRPYTLTIVNVSLQGSHTPSQPSAT